MKLKRVYEHVDVTDGPRILVDRLWPRGIRHNTPNVDLWIKDVAPSNELRKWFAHDPRKWVRFKARYMKELEDNRGVVQLLQAIRSTDPVTLVYSASDTEHNNAVALKEFLKRKFKIE